MNHAFAFALLLATTTVSATPLIAQPVPALGAPSAADEVSVPAGSALPAARPPSPAELPKADTESAKAADAQGRSFVANPLNTLAQQEKSLPVVPRLGPPPPLPPPAPVPAVSISAAANRTGVIEIWPVTIHSGTDGFEFAYEQVLAVVALLLFLYRSFFLKTVAARRALTGVAVACADEAVLAAHPELVGDLAARLARVERYLARSKKRARAIRRLPAELAGLVTRGTLDPFFALVETRTCAPGERAFPVLRDLLQGSSHPQ